MHQGRSGADVEQLLQELPGDKAKSRPRFELNLEGRFVVTMVSRLVKYQGVKEFLQTVRLVRKIYPRLVALLVGPQASEGRQAISPADLEEFRQDVLYLGPRADVPAVADLCVLPSYYREGVPRVLLEAAALGLPLLTTDTPGCKEVVRSEWNGLLVPPRDKQALASAIAQFLVMPKSRLVEMGMRGRSPYTGTVRFGPGRPGLCG